MNRETRSLRRADGSRERLCASRELRQRFVPCAGPAEKLDAISINNVLWIVVTTSKQGHLILQRALKRHADMSPEQLQESRNANNDYKNNIWRPRRKAQGLPTQYPRLAGTNKAAQALKWPFLLTLAAMCKEGFHAKAYDRFVRTFESRREAQGLPNASGF